MPPFSGETPIAIGGAIILPQSLWVLGGTAVMVFLMWLFFERMKLGKAMLAMSYNRLAARLVGINVRMVLMLSFMLAALLGAIGGALVAPLSVTYYEVGIMLASKVSARPSWAASDAAGGQWPAGSFSASPRRWEPATCPPTTRTPSPS